MVSRALDETTPEIESETAEIMPSNPFDLTFAAELGGVARGRRQGDLDGMAPENATAIWNQAGNPPDWRVHRSAILAVSSDP